MNASFSIITPVFNPPRDAFAACVQSVLDQNYPHWEWCLANDASTEDWVQAELDRLAASDPRIKVVHRDQNGGISRASNSALKMASGDFMAFLDHDDMLTPDALGSVNHYIELNESADFLYSDEDKVSDNGEFFDYFSKPAWSPERLLCQNYCCHLTVIKHELLELVGNLRPEFDGAQDYDLILRATEMAQRIVHIPRVLYHWRATAGSTALSVDEKPLALSAQRRAAQDAIQRRNLNGSVVEAGFGYHRVKRQPKWRPKVSIVIPTGGATSVIWGLTQPMIINMITSVIETSTYDDYEIIVVADSHCLNKLSHQLNQFADNVKVIEYFNNFNFSEKCNHGAIAATGEVLIFANDDMEVLTPDWIESTIGFLEEEDIGAVGPLLLYDNFTIQSAGHTAGPSHFGRGLTQRAAGGGHPLVLNREVVGLTGACIAIRTSTFHSVGGFSMTFPRSYNDSDLCFKLLSRGMRIIWTPDASLFHFESRSRDPKVEASEIDQLYQRWRHVLHYDPYLRVTSEPLR